MQEQLARRLAAVRARIDCAAAVSGRTGADVRLVAVTKYVGPEAARALVELGVTDLGENRLSTAQPKLDDLSDLSVRWHWIGRLQTNKARKVVERFDVIHSVDRLEVIEALERVVKGPNRVPVFLQVNVSGESTKAGGGGGEAMRIGERLAASQALDWVGLMTMAPEEEEAERTRPVFAAVRELRDQLERSLGVSLPRLSMGMSNDFEIAVSEGATDVRIGSLLFQG